MGLYNMLFGANPQSGAILEALGLRLEQIGRFRDAFITEEGFAIYTRLGGGNRECYCETDEHYCYQECIAALQSHPLYIRDVDDDFDCTYATFYFRFPDELKEALSRAAQGITFNPDERWSEMLESIKNWEPKEQHHANTNS